MRKLEIALDDGITQKLETYAAKLGLGVEAFLAQGIQQYADRFLSTFPTEWMPLDQWDALVRGEGVQSPEDEPYVTWQQRPTPTLPHHSVLFWRPGS